MVDDFVVIILSVASQFYYDSLINCPKCSGSEVCVLAVVLRSGSPASSFIGLTPLFSVAL